MYLIQTFNMKYELIMSLVSLNNVKNLIKHKMQNNTIKPF